MSGDPSKKSTQDPFAMLNEALKPFHEWQQKEMQRRALLTPTQRQREDEQRAAAAAVAKLAKLDDKMRRAVKGFTEYAAFTLLEFACLLRAINPADYSDWFLNSESGNVTELVKLLNTFVRESQAASGAVSLCPAVPSLPPAEWRFARDDLMRVAMVAKAGYIDSLVRVLGAPKSLVGHVPPPATVSLVRAPVTRTRGVRATSPGSPKPTRPLAAKKLVWQAQADALVQLVRERLEARANLRKEKLDVPLDEFLVKSSGRALYAEWQRRNVPSGKPPPVKWNHFRTYIGKTHRWLKFKGGDRGEGKPDEAVLSALLEDDHDPSGLPK